MHPILFEAGFFSIKTYGVFVAAAFFAGLLYLKVKSKRFGYPQKFIYDLSFYALVCALAGARIAYVALDFGYFLKNPLDIFKLWEGGLVFFGGLAGGFAGGMLVLRHYKIQGWLDVADLVSPALSLAHAIGRIGCFFAGCCYGVHTQCLCGVTFNDPQSIAPAGVKLMPVQLFESAGNFIIFIFLNRRFNKDGRPGSVFALYILCYSALRFIMEFFRGDYRGWMFFGFSILQVISLAAFAAALVFLVKLKNADNKNKL